MSLCGCDTVTFAEGDPVCRMERKCFLMLSFVVLLTLSFFLFAGDFRVFCICIMWKVMAALAPSSATSLPSMPT